jgi:hypothetical protein
MAADRRHRMEGCFSPQTFTGRHSRIDKPIILVQSGANRCDTRMGNSKKRLSISLEVEDYDALRALAEGHRPPLSLQYVLNVAVKDLLEKHASRQLALPLDK